MIIVSDSTPLIILAKVNHFELLQLLFREIIIPYSVYREVAIVGRGKAGANELVSADWIKVEHVQDQEVAKELRKGYNCLSQADAEVIVLAQERQANFLLADDRELRRIARTVLGDTTILYTGSVLIFAKHEGLIDSVGDLLDNMRAEGIWMDDEVYSQILTQAGEL